MKTTRVFFFFFCFCLCLVLNGQRAIMKQRSSPKENAQGRRSVQKIDLQRNPSAQELDRYLSSLSAQQKPAILADLVTEYIQLSIDAYNSHDSKAMAYYTSLEPVLNKHLEGIETIARNNQDLFADNEVSQPQRLTPQQLDAQLSSASPEERDLLISQFWEATVLTFCMADQSGVQYLHSLAPVIMKYDPMFQYHEQMAMNMISNLANGNGHRQPPMSFPSPAGGYNNQTCVGCGGTLKCSQCHGEGRNMTSGGSWTWCRSCDGTGLCSVCKRGYGPAPIRAVCVGCNGTGKCDSCKGNGGYTTSSGTWLRCSRCRGAGNCGICHGHGYTSR